jgi:hypothetical protein
MDILFLKAGASGLIPLGEAARPLFCSQPAERINKTIKPGPH